MPSKDADGRRRARGRKPLLIALTALVLALGSTSVAAGASNIEGVWSFQSGQIAIQPLSGGTFVGTVVVQTQFAECVHPVGEQIWTGITPQPDGSYWGLHQWFFKTTNCQRNPQLGPTAWRVLEESNGSKYLMVCLSNPGTTQPTIPANGSGKDATYGCFKSALTAPLPIGPGLPGSGPGSAPGGGVASEVEHLSLPSARKCLSLRRFQIHLLEPKLDPFKKVTVTIKGHKIATTRKGNYLVATINLKGLQRGAFTITIHADTVLGHHLTAKRTYHTCAKKAKNRKRAKAH
jgi:hypothetical protein